MVIFVFPFFSKRISFSGISREIIILFVSTSSVVLVRYVLFQVSAFTVLGGQGIGAGVCLYTGNRVARYPAY